MVQHNPHLSFGSVDQRFYAQVFSGDNLIAIVFCSRSADDQLPVFMVENHNSSIAVDVILERMVKSKRLKEIMRG